MAEGSSDATLVHTVKSTVGPMPISPGYTDLQYKGTAQHQSEYYDHHASKAPNLHEYDTSQSLQIRRMTLDPSHDNDKSTKSIKSIIDVKDNGGITHVVEEDNNLVLHTENSDKKIMDPTMSLTKMVESVVEPVQTMMNSPNPYEDLLRSGAGNTKRNLWIKPKTFQIKTHNRSVTQLATSMAAVK